MGKNIIIWKKKRVVMILIPQKVLDFFSSPPPATAVTFPIHPIDATFWPWVTRSQCNLGNGTTATRNDGKLWLLALGFGLRKSIGSTEPQFFWVFML